MTALAGDVASTVPFTVWFPVNVLAAANLG
jgi:hypothetical protein